MILVIIIIIIIFIRPFTAYCNDDGDSNDNDIYITIETYHLC